MTDDWLQREQVGFAELDETVYRERLRAHVIADSASERPFSLFDPSGEWVAGNQLNEASSLVTAAPRDRPFDFTLTRGGHQQDYRGMVHRTASGNLLLIAQNTGDGVLLR